MTFRNLLLTGHLWLGLISGIWLLGLGLSGAVLAFMSPLDDALNGHLLRVAASPTKLSLAELQARVEKTTPGARVMSVFIPEDANHSYEFMITQKGVKGLSSVFMDPYTGQRLGTSAERHDLRAVQQFHVRLLAGETGETIIGWAAVGLVLLSSTGLILWWPGKRLRLRWRSPGRVLVGDLHHVIGAYAWVFLMMFSVTGIMLHWQPLAQRLVSTVTGSDASRRAPPETKACEGKPPLPWDDLLAAATAAAPGAQPRWLQSMGPSLVRATLKFPEDRTPAGRTLVFVEACSGKVLAVQSTRSAPLAFRIMAMGLREVHTGDVFGWPTRLLAAFFSLCLPVMALTGPIMWWQKRRKPTRDRALSSEPPLAGSGPTR